MALPQEGNMGPPAPSPRMNIFRSVESEAARRRLEEARKLAEERKRAKILLDDTKRRAEEFKDKLKRPDWLTLRHGLEKREVDANKPKPMLPPMRSIPAPTPTATPRPNEPVRRQAWQVEQEKRAQERGQTNQFAREEQVIAREARQPNSPFQDLTPEDGKRIQDKLATVPSLTRAAITMSVDRRLKSTMDGLSPETNVLLNRIRGKDLSALDELIANPTALNEVVVHAADVISVGRANKQRQYTFNELTRNVPAAKEFMRLAVITPGVGYDEYGNLTLKNKAEYDLREQTSRRIPWSLMASHSPEVLLTLPQDKQIDAMMEYVTFAQNNFGRETPKLTAEEYAKLTPEQRAERERLQKFRDDAKLRNEQRGTKYDPMPVFGAYANTEVENIGNTALRENRMPTQEELDRMSLLFMVDGMAPSPAVTQLLEKVLDKSAQERRLLTGTPKQANTIAEKIGSLPGIPGPETPAGTNEYELASRLGVMADTDKLKKPTLWYNEPYYTRWPGMDVYLKERPNNPLVAKTIARAPDVGVWTQTFLQDKGRLPTDKERDEFVATLPDYDLHALELQQREMRDQSLKRETLVTLLADATSPARKALGELWHQGDLFMRPFVRDGLLPVVSAAVTAPIKILEADATGGSIVLSAIGGGKQVDYRGTISKPVANVIQSQLVEDMITDTINPVSIAVLLGASYVAAPMLYGEVEGAATRTITTALARRIAADTFLPLGGLEGTLLRAPFTISHAGWASTRAALRGITELILDGPQALMRIPRATRENPVFRNGLVRLRTLIENEVGGGTFAGSAARATDEQELRVLQDIKRGITSSDDLKKLRARINKEIYDRTSPELKSLETEVDRRIDETMTKIVSIDPRTGEKTTLKALRDELEVLHAIRSGAKVSKELQPVYDTMLADAREATKISFAPVGDAGDTSTNIATGDVGDVQNLTVTADGVNETILDANVYYDAVRSAAPDDIVTLYHGSAEPFEGQAIRAGTYLTPDPVFAHAHAKNRAAFPEDINVFKVTAKKNEFTSVEDGMYWKNNEDVVPEIYDTSNITNNNELYAAEDAVAQAKDKYINATAKGASGTKLRKQLEDAEARLAILKTNNAQAELPSDINIVNAPGGSGTDVNNAWDQGWITPEEALRSSDERYTAENLLERAKAGFPTSVSDPGGWSYMLPDGTYIAMGADGHQAIGFGVFGDRPLGSAVHRTAAEIAADKGPNITERQVDEFMKRTGAIRVFSEGVDANDSQFALDLARPATQAQRTKIMSSVQRHDPGNVYITFSGHYLGTSLRDGRGFRNRSAIREFLEADPPEAWMPYITHGQNIETEVDRRIRDVESRLRGVARNVWEDEQGGGRFAELEVGKDSVFVTSGKLKGRTGVVTGTTWTRVEVTDALDGTKFSVLKSEIEFTATTRARKMAIAATPRMDAITVANQRVEKAFARVRNANEDEIALRIEEYNNAKEEVTRLKTEIIPAPSINVNDLSEMSRVERIARVTKLQTRMTGAGPKEKVAIQREIDRIVHYDMQEASATSLAHGARGQGDFEYDITTRERELGAEKTLLERFLGRGESRDITDARMPHKDIKTEKARAIVEERLNEIEKELDTIRGTSLADRQAAQFDSIQITYESVIESRSSTIVALAKRIQEEQMALLQTFDPIQSAAHIAALDALREQLASIRAEAIDAAELLTPAATRVSSHIRISPLPHSFEDFSFFALSQAKAWSSQAISKVGKIPIVRELIGSLNPSFILADDVIGRYILGYHRLQNFFKASTEAALHRINSVRAPFELTDEGLEVTTNLQLSDLFEKWYEVAPTSNGKTYKEIFSTEHDEWFDLFRRAHLDMLEDARLLGVKIPDTWFEDAHAFRIAVTKDGLDLRVAGNLLDAENAVRPGSMRARSYELAKDGMTKGVLYHNDFIADQTIGMLAFRQWAAHEAFTNAIGASRGIPEKLLAAQEYRLMASLTAREAMWAKVVRNYAHASMGGLPKKPTTRVLKSGLSMPAELQDVMEQIAKLNATGLVGVAKRDKGLKALVEKADKMYETYYREFKAARSEFTSARKRLSSVQSSGVRWGKAGPVRIRPAPSEFPGLSGKKFLVDDMEFLIKHMSREPKNDVAKGLVSLGSFVGRWTKPFRLAQTGFDFGFWFLQGLSLFGMDVIRSVPLVGGSVLGDMRTNPLLIPLLAPLGATPLGKLGVKSESVWGKAIWRSLLGFVDSDFTARYWAREAAAHAASYDNFLTHARISGLTQDLEELNQLERFETKMPGLKQTKPIKRFGDSITAFLNASSWELWKAIEPLADGDIQKLEDLGAFVRNMSGRSQVTEMGISSGQQTLERAAAYAPSYTRAGLALIGKAVFDGVLTGGTNFGGRQAVKALTGMAASLTIMMGAITLAKHLDGNGYDFEKLDWEDMADDIKASWNPADPSNFFAVRWGDAFIGVGGNMRSNISLISRIIRAMDNDPKSLSPFSLESSGIPLINDDHVVLRWLRGKSNPVLGTAWDIFTGKDYFGYSFDDPKDYLIKGTTLVLPFWAQGLVYSRSGLDSPGMGLASYFGLNSIPVDPQTLYQEQAERDFDMPWKDIVGQPFLRDALDNPEDFPELIDAHERVAEDRRAKDSLWQQLTDLYEKDTTERNAQLSLEVPKVNMSVVGSGERYSSQRNSIFAQHSDNYKTLAAGLELDTNSFPESTQKDIILNSQLAQLKLDDFPLPGNKVDFDAYYAARDDIVNQMTPANQKAIRDKKYDYDDPALIQMEKTRDHAIETLQEWMDTPKYNGLTNEESDRVDRIRDSVKKIRIQMIGRGEKPADVTHKKILAYMLANNVGDHALNSIAYMAEQDALSSTVLSQRKSQLTLENRELAIFYSFTYYALSKEEQEEWDDKWQGAPVTGTGY